MSTTRKMRMGMVGGGQGAFIGAVHRIGAAIDQQIDLVCGAFSTKQDICKATGSCSSYWRENGLCSHRDSEPRTLPCC